MLLLLYITIVAYSITPYISYEDPVQLTTATTTTTDTTSNTTNSNTPIVADPCHVSHDEVHEYMKAC